MGSSATPLRVLIIGSGSAGLLFAQVLKKAGIAATVFEQDASFYARPRDWNFGIYWAQNGLGSCLPEELHHLVKTVQTDGTYDTDENNTMPIHNGATGEMLTPMSAAFGWRVQRKKWLEMLSIGIDIKWSKRLQSIETSDDGIVTAIFEDGTKESGNLLVGAEGAHSWTREYLVGPEEAALLPCPIVASITITSISREAALALRALNRNHCITLHPNGVFTWTGIHNCESKDPAKWTFMLIQSWKSDEATNLEGDAILQDVYARGKSYAYPFNEVFASIPLGTKVWHNRLSTWPTKPWDGKGLVTLAGDAAHPMTFHRGQGVNNAITDASDFLVHLQAMKSHTPSELQTAVKNYETALFPRGKEAVMASYKNSLLVHDWETALQSPLFTQGLKKYKLKEEDVEKIQIVDVKASAAVTLFETANSIDGPATAAYVAPVKSAVAIEV